MDGSHTITCCEEVTGAVLHVVFRALFEQGVLPEATLLKPSMVIAGKDCRDPTSVQEVAAATLRCLPRDAPAVVSEIVFLSGGQEDWMATTHLNAINQLPGPKPWTIGFPYGRALQDAALEAWCGQAENVKAGQQALYHRARCNGAVSVGTYSDETEAQPASAGSLTHRRDCHDD